MIVADATLLIHFALPTANESDAEAAKAVYARDPDWRVTLLWASEVRHVGVKYVRRGDLDPADLLAALRALDEVVSAGAGAVGHEETVQSALGLGLSAYDAEYASLAERLGAPLVTSDRGVLAAVERAVTPRRFAGLEGGG